MGYNKTMMMEMEQYHPSQYELEMDQYYSSLEAKINASNDTLTPQWILDIDEDNKCLNELKNIQKEVDTEKAIYLRWKKLMEGGLDNHQANLDFQLFSGSSKNLLK
jgi:hypothetical protein